MRERRGRIRGDIAGDLELAKAAHAHMASLAVKINAGTYDVDEPDAADSMPPLRKAVAARKGALTRFLLAQGAERGENRGDHGDTPLHIAARTGSGEDVQAARAEGCCAGRARRGRGRIDAAARGALGWRNGSKGAHAELPKLFMDEMKRLGRGAEAAAIIAGTRTQD